MTFSGVVSFNRDSTDGDISDVYTVSTRGASMLVHSPVDATGTLKPPPVGSFISVTVEIKDTLAEADPGTFPNPPPPQAAPAVASCPGPNAAPAEPLPTPPVATPKSLYEKALTIQAPAADVDSGEIAGVVQAVCPATGEMLLSADDLREAKADLFDPFNGKALVVAPGVDLTGFTPGQPVLANVALAEDADPNSLAAKLPTTVTGIRDDRGIAGADGATGQGDLRIARRAASR